MRGGLLEEKEPAVFVKHGVVQDRFTTSGAVGVCSGWCRAVPSTVGVVGVGLLCKGGLVGFHVSVCACENLRGVDGSLSPSREIVMLFPREVVLFVSDYWRFRKRKNRVP